MRKSLLLVALVAIFLLVSAVPDARADSSVGFPDGSFSIAIALGGGVVVFLFFDFAGSGDLDIFTHHVNSFGNLVFVSLAGLPSGLAYWLDFRGPVGSRLLYDVFTTTGGPFFFVGQILLG